MSKPASEKQQIANLKRELKEQAAAHFRQVVAFENQIRAGRELARVQQAELEALRRSMAAIELALTAKGFEVPK